MEANPGTVPLSRLLYTFSVVSPASAARLTGSGPTSALPDRSRLFSPGNDAARQAGMVPATVKREVAGFVLNRLQVALVAEAFRLVADGVVSPEDIDATVKHGLGLRWSFMGPFETIDLNAPGGVADYCARYGGLYDTVQAEMTPLALTPELVAEVDAARRAALPMQDHAARLAWRDKRLMALLAHKKAQAE